jgi:hypothetical protein
MVLQTVLPSVAEANIWKERRAAYRAASAPVPSSISPVSTGALPLPGALENGRSLELNGLVLPEKVLNALPVSQGSLRAVGGRGASDRLVLHIHDVHGDPVAQKAISEAIKIFVSRMQGQVGVVALEGAFGPLDFSQAHALPQKASLTAAADYLLEQHVIAGPLHAGLSADKAMPLVGVDDADLYAANVNAYKLAAPLQAEARRLLADARTGLSDRADKTLSPALKALEASVQSFHEGGSLVDYAEGMESARKASGLAPVRELSSFLSLSSREKSLDFDKAEKERSTLVERLTESLPRERLSALTAQAAALRSGAMSQSAFFRALAPFCREAGVSLAAYPALTAYVGYMESSEGLNANLLFTALADLEQRAIRSLASTREEKELASALRLSRLQDRLISFAMTPDEWKEYSALSGRSLDLSAFENFYRFAEKRDAAMARNLHHAVLRAKTRVAVLVTGGFHAPGLDKQLAKAGMTLLSFVPVTSSELGETADNLSLFLKGPTAYEKLLAPAVSTLSQNVFSAGQGIDLAAKTIGAAEAADENNLPAADETQVLQALAPGLPVSASAEDAGPGKAKVSIQGENLLGFVEEIETKDGKIFSAAEAYFNFEGQLFFSLRKLVVALFTPVTRLFSSPQEELIPVQRPSSHSWLSRKVRVGLFRSGLAAVALVFLNCSFGPQITTTNNNYKFDKKAVKAFNLGKNNLDLDKIQVYRQPDSGDFVFEVDERNGQVQGYVIDVEGSGILKQDYFYARGTVVEEFRQDKSSTLLIANNSVQSTMILARKDRIYEEKNILSDTGTTHIYGKKVDGVGDVGILEVSRQGKPTYKLFPPNGDPVVLTDFSKNGFKAHGAITQDVTYVLVRQPEGAVLLDAFKNPYGAIQIKDIYSSANGTTVEVKNRFWPVYWKGFVERPLPSISLAGAVSSEKLPVADTLKTPADSTGKVKDPAPTDSAAAPRDSIPSSPPSPKDADPQQLKIGIDRLKSVVPNQGSIVPVMKMLLIGSVLAAVQLLSQGLFDAPAASAAMAGGLMFAVAPRYLVDRAIDSFLGTFFDRPRGLSDKDPDDARAMNVLRAGRRLSKADLWSRFGPALRGWRKITDEKAFVPPVPADYDGSRFLSPLPDLLWKAARGFRASSLGQFVLPQGSSRDYLLLTAFHQGRLSHHMSQVSAAVLPYVSRLFPEKGRALYAGLAAKIEEKFSHRANRKPYAAVADFRDLDETSRAMFIDEAVKRLKKFAPAINEEQGEADVRIAALSILLPAWVDDTMAGTIIFQMASEDVVPASSFRASWAKLPIKFTRADERGGVSMEDALNGLPEAAVRGGVRLFSDNTENIVMGRYQNMVELLSWLLAPLAMISLDGFQDELKALEEIAKHA